MSDSTEPDMTYPAWALATFDKRILQVLTRVASDERSARWIETCKPGTGEQTRFRLFPGALYLLWLEALGVEPGDEHARVAAALECLHNASLHHDDVLDHHDSRRGVQTLRAVSGAPASLLAGDGLLGIAFSLLTAGGERALSHLAAAWLRMTQGQAMDEPATWERIDPGDRPLHWERMTRHKLALGNAAGPLAATSAGRLDCEPKIAMLHEQFSVVSQIMNDVGDLLGWAGFHSIAPCARAPGSEVRQKPTYATMSGPSFLRRASTEIDARTSEALALLETIAVRPEVKPTLVDFFRRPRLELRRVAPGGPRHA